MPTHYNLPLVVAAILSAIAALLHVGIIVGGAPWYRFFGAGDSMARADAAGRVYPAVVTAFIALVLATWSAYALAGAGVIAPLPQLKAALVGITAVYLLRGLAVVPLLLFARHQATPFLVWSSLICIGLGAVHLAGLAQVWHAV
ncbi:hypothetical protein KY495_18905 [Massilia sp. PAMC28688]|uniref:hypothetical protein n=1 Tax=Massilia sp. PAMC28688 TaxID=2861283 RepID=UPI001C62701E|nr:hypothetical protein [Massilia sp. PAMC28688]QYF92776.1 hypothetical protein KY495_18905 [Massilia sp. PAMC28688]